MLPRCGYAYTVGPQLYRPATAAAGVKSSIRRPSELYSRSSWFVDTMPHPTGAHMRTAGTGGSRPRRRRVVPRRDPMMNGAILIVPIPVASSNPRTVGYRPLFLAMWPAPVTSWKKSDGAIWYSRYKRRVDVAGAVPVEAVPVGDNGRHQRRGQAGPADAEPAGDGLAAAERGTDAVRGVRVAGAVLGVRACTRQASARCPGPRGTACRSWPACTESSRCRRWYRG
jgi:hypothetical protein